MRVAIRLFTVMVLFSSVMMIIFVFHHVRLDKVFNLLAYVYFDKTLCMFFAALTGFVVLMNFVCFCQILSAVTYEKKIIAFDNPAGRVSVSLTAIEELTKRVISQTSEVREVKSKISVSKKGLLIKIRLVLRAEGSIPEVTSRVQELVKRKVQSTIGLDEPIEVAIFVGKILPDQGKEKQPAKKEESQKGPQQNVPFQGYRA